MELQWLDDCLVEDDCVVPSKPEVVEDHDVICSTSEEAPKPKITLQPRRKPHVEIENVRPFLAASTFVGCFNIRWLLQHPLYPLSGDFLFQY